MRIEPAAELLLAAWGPDLLPCLEELQAGLTDKGWRLVQPTNPEGLEAYLSEGHPSVVVVDWGAETAQVLPGAAQRLTARFASSGVPVVVLVPAEELERLTDEQHLADELIASPVSAHRLQARILQHGRRHRIVQQYMRIDPVTGAHNLVALREQLEKQIQEMQRSLEPISLVYLTLDGRKELQVSDGLERVDRLRRELAQFMKGSIRPTDTLALHADGSFVLLLPMTSKEDAVKLMKKRMERWATHCLQLQHEAAEGSREGSFSARILEITDGTPSADELLSRLPFGDDRPEETRYVLSDVLEDEGAAYTKRLKIAVIDDDRMVRDLLGRSLLQIGEECYDIEVRCFESGEAYFADPWHRQNERYIVIIDRILPGMDGLDVLRRIRDNYDRRRYQCVMLTARVTETEIALAMQEGANDYIVKPFSLKELRARLRRLVRGQR